MSGEMTMTVRQISRLMCMIGKLVGEPDEINEDDEGLQFLWYVPGREDEVDEQGNAPLSAVLDADPLLLHIKIYQAAQEWMTIATWCAINGVWCVCERFEEPATVIPNKWVRITAIPVDDENAG